MVMLAIAVSLATRVTMVVNLVCCLVVFFLGNLSPVLVQASQQLQGGALALVGFLARLFDILLPSLQYASTSQVYIRETPLGAQPNMPLMSVLWSAISSFTRRLPCWPG